MDDNAELRPARPLGRAESFLLPLLLLIMGAYPPLTTDMYLPALGRIATEFDAPESTVNLTLVLFFIVFAVSTLAWGPISDKFGRKRPLIAGIALFGLASGGCIFAASIEQMIVWRVLQALGAGAPVTISIAIVQDTYAGEAKRKILATLTALMMIAPVVAPTLGSAILMVSGWRWIFGGLLILGLGSLVGCLFIRESIPRKSIHSIPRVFLGLFSVLKDPFFRKALVLFSLPALYALGFVGGSALIFMSEFGVSSGVFSLMFAANAVFAIIGAVLYVPALRRLSVRRITMLSFLVMALSGVLIMTLGRSSALAFLLCVMPGTTAGAMLRPLSVDMMMDAGGRDSGAASSMINFFFTLVGSLGMQVIALDWGSRAVCYGVLAAGAGVCGLVAWPWVYRSVRS